MKRLLLLILLPALSIMATAQTRIRLTVGDKTLSATLTDNDATRRLVSLLSDGPITITMDDYGGFEKVGALPEALPASDSRITTVPGDIMLYQGRNMVIFYDSNTWSYTRLGKIDSTDAAGLREFLGNGSIRLSISLDTTSAAAEIAADNTAAIQAAYDLTGNQICRRPLPPSIYIVDGRKTIVH